MKDDTQTKLPSDIISEILVRLPARTVIGRRAVCKLFKSLTTEPTFIAAHTLRSKNTPSSLIVKCPQSFGFPFWGLVENCYKVDDEVEGDRKELVSRPMDLSDKALKMQLTYSCDGLLCFKEYFKNKNFYICNPVTRQCIKIELPIEDKIHSEVLGFYYSSFHKEYRLLVQTPNNLEVFGLRTRSLKPVKCSIDFFESLIEIPGVLVNGKLYWRGTAKFGQLLFSFDKNKEELKQLKQPKDCIIEQLLEMEGKLYVVGLDWSSRNFLFWALEDDDKAVWTKMFVVLYGSFQCSKRVHPWVSTNDGKICFGRDDTNGTVFLYDIKLHEVVAARFDDFLPKTTWLSDGWDTPPTIHKYVETLVSSKSIL